MKPIVVFYSFSGNNRLLAGRLSEILNCEKYPLVEQKKRRGLTILLDLMLNREAKLHPLQVSLADYDHIVFVAPLWNARLASPMSTFIRQQRQNIRDYSFISLCGYQRPEQAKKITAQLSALAGSEPEAVAELALAELFPERDRNNYRKISGYSATSSDLDHFTPQIDHFLDRVRPAMPRQAAREQPRPGLTP